MTAPVGNRQFTPINLLPSVIAPGTGLSLAEKLIDSVEALPAGTVTVLLTAYEVGEF